ncbi:MAG: hypothetical protein HN932_12970 [Candidatus Marinimicrobia bacterium]|nr:hypothetical protein [Candidatus Neomarinimicrobiota bacterium]MBT7339065.1 hypothetical protein [Candidatus Jacksonbacteria bacterium]
MAWTKILTTTDVDDSPVNGASTVPVSSNWAYDHNAGTGNSKHVPAAGSVGQFLQYNGTWATPPDLNTWRNVDDTPVNGVTTESISSNWAYDHAASSTGHPIDARTVAVAGDTMTGNLTMLKANPMIDIRALDEDIAVLRLCDNEADTTQMARLEFNTASSDALRFYVNSTTAEMTLTSAGALTVLGGMAWSGGTSANANTAYGWGDHAGLYSVLAHNHDSDYLGLTAQANDSDQLDGYDSTAFPRKAEAATISSTWTFNNITVSGTVDGRDVSVDGTKLDTIATSANNYTFPYTVSASAGNSTVVQRHSSGYIYANYFNTTPNTVTSGVTQVCVETGNDGFIRHGSAGAIRTFINVASGATANTGTVTSVATSGSVSGLTLTGGPITTSGTVTLGGTISISASNITDVAPFSQSGTYMSLRAGATTKGDVGLGSVENTALSTWAGTSSITTVGTLSSGAIPWSLITGEPTHDNYVSWNMIDSDDGVHAISSGENFQIKDGNGLTSAYSSVSWTNEITFTLGTPSTTTQATSNAVTGSSHTHAWTHTSSSNWDTAYGWGNHASAGYLTSETDSQTLSYASSTGILTISGGNTADLGIGTSDSPTFAALTITGNGTFGSTSRTANTTVKALAGNGYNTGFEAYGLSQGTGYMYVGQSTTHGGGMYYNGDGTPSFATGESTDHITFYRNASSTKTVVFDYGYNDGIVDFKVGPTSSGVAIATVNTNWSAADITSGTLAVARGGTGLTSGYNNTNWDTAYGWGNHASAGYTSNTGTVTSVGTTGTVSGITLTGTVTTSGTLTLGGTVAITSANISDVAAFSQSGTYMSLRAGATTAGDVGLGSVENTALSTWAGSANITTLGTVTTVGNVDGRDIAADGTKLDGIEDNANEYTLTKAGVEAVLTGAITTHTHAVGSHNLTDHGDVSISAVGAGEIMYYNGGTWQNATLAEASVSGTSHNHSGTYEPADSAIVKSDEAETISASWNFSNALVEVADKIGHYGDTDTYMTFGTNTWGVYTGGGSAISVNTSQQTTFSQQVTTAKNLIVGSGLSISASDLTLATGNIVVAGGATVDGVDVSALNIAVSSHYSDTSTHGVTGSILGTEDVDDTPVNGATTVPVSSNWAYDHVSASDPHSVYGLKDRPAFLVTNEVADTFGVGIQTKVDFNLEIFDTNSNFSADTFTAPSAGKYQLNCTLRLDNIDTGASNYQIRFVTSNRTYYWLYDPNFTADLSYNSFQIAELVDMDASDTAYVAVYQVSGANQSDVDGQTNLWTRFSGFLAIED